MRADDFIGMMIKAVWNLLQTPMTFPEPIGVVNPLMIMIYFEMLTLLIFLVTYLMGYSHEDAAASVDAKVRRRERMKRH